MNAHPPEDEQGIEVEDIARLLPAPPVPELSDDRLRELRGSISEEIRIGRPRRRRRLIVVAVAVAAVAAAVFAALSIGATAGALDTSFGGDGKVTDASFGGDGKVVTNLTRRNDFVSALAIQADGKIVLAGDGVARYNSDGTLDASFGVNGKVRTTNPEGPRAWRHSFVDMFGFATGVAIQADGKIVVVGRGSGPHSDYPGFALARWNSDGTLDTSFGVDGKVRTHFSANSSDNASGVAIQADGKIVVVGVAGSGPDKHPVFALARYNSDGTLDASFGVNGKVMTDFTPRGDGAAGVAIQADGKIVVVGGAAGWGKFALARYNSDGTLDASFGVDGKVMTDFTSGNDSATGVAIQADGKIVAAGVAGDYSGHSRFALARYNSDGTLDASFGVDGKVMTDFTSGNDYASGVAIQADGKIVAAGVAADQARNSKFALARYNSDGTLDASFGVDGKVMTDFTPRGDGASGVAIQADGRIVLAGTANVSSRSKMKVALARYLAQ